MTAHNLLVRTATGTWERLEARTDLPQGGVVDVLGEDIGPVLGSPTPLLVAACQPTLPTGTPDALCVAADGTVTVLTVGLGTPPDDLLARLLSFAGSLHGMSYEDFERICDRVTAADGGLAGFVKTRAHDPSFHAGTFEVTVADALAHGRFELATIVGTAPATLRQSMRYLNASGANVGLYEAQLFAADSVMALQATAVDVGHQHEEPTMSAMTASGLLATTSRVLGDTPAELMTHLQKFCSSAFDETAYEGDTSNARMVASVHGADGLADVLTASSDGKIELCFEAFAEFDPTWTVRVDLAESMERMLGAELGEVRKISRLNLDLREHLNDATLMEMFTEMLGDALAAAGAGTKVAAGAAA